MPSFFLFFWFRWINLHKNATAFNFNWDLLISWHSTATNSNDSSNDSFSSSNWDHLIPWLRCDLADKWVPKWFPRPFLQHTRYISSVPRFEMSFLYSEKPKWFLKWFLQHTWYASSAHRIEILSFLDKWFLRYVPITYLVRFFSSSCDNFSSYLLPVPTDCGFILWPLNKCLSKRSLEK